MLDEARLSETIPPPIPSESEAVMVGQERWEQVRQMFFEERVTIAEIARRLEIERKTVRRCLRAQQWQPYRRAPKEETLLSAHADFLRERAAQVQYSAQILFQELRRQRGYTGSYETVKRFVAPLRELQLAAEATQLRFETPPGQQSQIDWGQAQVPFRSGRRAVHFFVLTLGYSRRGFYWPSADERLGQFLDAHERAFAHERAHLGSTASQRSFAQEGRRRRIVASDYLVSLQIDRYSVPSQLIGQTVELQAREGLLRIYHRARLVAEHPLLEAQHQLRILPEHGP